MQLIAGILVMAAVTYLPRVVPLLLMQKPIKSQFVQSFLFYTPYTVLTAMTFPAMIYATGDTISGLIGTIVAIGTSLLGGSLLKVSMITVGVVYVINIL